MNRLPEKEKPAFEKKEVTMWERVKPWVYMAAMFVGAALIIRVASSNHTPVKQTVWLPMKRKQKWNISIWRWNNSMLDDYSLYVYLADSGAE